MGNNMNVNNKMKESAPRLYWIDFLGKRHIAVWVSIILSIAALVSLGLKGLNFAIDFTGGTVVEVEFKQPANVKELRENLEAEGFKGPMVQLFGTTVMF